MHNDTETLDLALFRSLVAGAQAAGSLASGRPEELYRLREALSLWHGTPLANVASRMLQRDAVPVLEQERLRVLERVCDLELAAGNCHQVLVDLYESARRHPVRERFTEQLIEALYRTGRQAEALAEYRTVRERLRDELGVDPGAGLRRSWSCRSCAPRTWAPQPPRRCPRHPPHPSRAPCPRRRRSTALPGCSPYPGSRGARPTAGRWRRGSPPPADHG